MTRFGGSLCRVPGYPRSIRAAGRAALLAVSLAGAAVGTARADDSPSPPSAAAAVGAAQPAPVPPGAPSGAPFPAQPPAAARPGFLHQLGVWWNDGFADFNAKMKNAKDQLDEINNAPATQDALKNAAQATKDAATAVVRLPATRVFELHDHCPLAGNGAPDCQTAAANACQGKGFTGGQPLDVSTSQECPARAALSGQPVATGGCRDETVILRVVCQ